MSQTFHPSVDEVAAATAQHLRRGKNLNPHTVLGPVVWELNDDLRRWYFIAITGNDKGARIDRLAAATKPLCQDLRSALAIALVHHRPLVIHDMDDELEMMRLCEILWPSPKTTRIRARIEAERQVNTR
jgi:hypothetical protein